MSQVRYHRVPETFWTLTRGWAEKTIILGLYLQTCKHRTTEGLYPLPLAYAAADLGWTPAVITRHLAILGRAGVVKYDSKAEVVLLPNALEIQAPKAPDPIKGAIRRLKEVPESPLLKDLYGYASTYSTAFAEAIREAFPVVTRVGTPGEHSNGKSNSHSSPLTQALSTSSKA